MGKVKLLFGAIGGLRSLADSLQAVADAVADSGAAEAELTTTKEPEKAGKTGKAAARNTAKKDAKPAAKQEPEEKPLTLEEVRAVLAEKSRAGHTAEVKELLNKHGADKLSEIDPAEYAAPVCGSGGAVRGKHALLSASSSHRWLACPPSARLCENYEDKGSEYAQQGIDAHSLCEHKLKLSLGMETKDPTEGLSFYDEEMEECACGYAEYVLSLVEEAKKECKDPVVLIEQRLDFSWFVDEGFGTGDCVIIADGTLYIIDYKHGKGVEVSAEGNPQMMLYASRYAALESREDSLQKERERKEIQYDIFSGFIAGLSETAELPGHRVCARCLQQLFLCVEIADCKEQIDLHGNLRRIRV